MKILSLVEVFDKIQGRIVLKDKKGALLSEC